VRFNAPYRDVQAVLDGLIVKHRTKQLAELHT
jgi:hypothetical protein